MPQALEVLQRNRSEGPERARLEWVLGLLHTGRRLLAANGAGGIRTQYSLSGQQTYIQSGRTGNKEENIYLAGSIVATRVWNAATSYWAKFHYTDALGSPIAVTNQAGVVIERNDYEPYGAIIGKPNYQGIG